MISSPRILGGIRLSKDYDDTSSPERQRDAIDYWANAPHLQGTTIGWAEDLDVSGSIHPFKRPSLGPWFAERADEWDVLAVQKIDRLTRRSRHFGELVDWCIARGKTIVSVGEGIDMSTPMGKMFMSLIAVFAEGELDTIKQRAQDAVNTRLNKGAWFGGTAPFGYQIAKNEDGVKVLIQDEEGAQLLRWIIDRLKDDWTPYRIATHLNAKNVLTWGNHKRKMRNKPLGPNKWSISGIIAIVTNPTIAGYYTYKDQLVEDEDGNPRMITTNPIATPLEWTAFATRFAKGRTKDEDKAIPSQSELGTVAKCGDCGGKLNSSTKTKKLSNGESKAYTYYLCSNANTGICNSATRVVASVLEEIVSNAIFAGIGEKHVYEKAVTGGSVIRTELTASAARLERLEGDFLAGRYDGQGQSDSYWNMHAKLSAKVSRLREELERVDNAPSHIDTGRTYAEAWREKDSDQRRVFLLKHNVSVIVFKYAVDDADESVIVEFGNLESIAREGNLELDGMESHRVDHNVPFMSHGNPATVDEMREITRERNAILNNPQTDYERDIAAHRKSLINKRARSRRVSA